MTDATLRPDVADSPPRPSTRVTVGIIADDLTGAGDSAVQFAEAGWQTSLVLSDTIAVNTGGVIATVTDARAQPFEAARLGTECAVAQLREAGIDRLFVKIDSTMRGSVDAQIRGALTAWAVADPDSVADADSAADPNTDAVAGAGAGAGQRPFAIVCPAYPAMGRTVQVGRLLVNGVKVELTSIGRDPVTPVRTGLVSALIPGSMNLAIGTDDASTLADRITALVAAGIEIVTVDATTDAELELIAEATVLLGSAAIPVGSAGLAIAMSRLWATRAEAASANGDLADDVRAFDSNATSVIAGPASGSAALPTPADAAQSASPVAREPRDDADRILVVVSSLHDVSREQHQHLVTVDLAERVRTLAPTLKDLADEASTAAWLAGEFGRSIDLPRVVVILSPSERHAPDPAAAQQDPAVPSAAIRIATGLAELTEAVLNEAAISALVLMGGEGARAVLDRLGAEAIRVTGAIREGIPVGVIEGGLLDGLAVVTKAGGFGERSTLADLVPELLSQTGHANHVAQPGGHEHGHEHDQHPTHSTNPTNTSQGAQS